MTNFTANFFAIFSETWGAAGGNAQILVFWI